MDALNVVLEGQGETNWCWAAVGAAIANYRFGSAKQPCDVASEILHGPCCTRPDAWNQTQDVGRVLNRLQLLEATVDRALSFGDLAEQIRVRRLPVVARIAFLSSGLAHYVLISGYASDWTVSVQDPWGPARIDLSYVEFTNNYPGVGGTGGAAGIWTDSYLIR